MSKKSNQDKDNQDNIDKRYLNEARGATKEAGMNKSSVLTRINAFFLGNKEEVKERDKKIDEARWQIASKLKDGKNIEEIIDVRKGKEGKNQEVLNQKKLHKDSQGKNNSDTIELTEINANSNPNDNTLDKGFIDYSTGSKKYEYKQNVNKNPNELNQGFVVGNSSKYKGINELKIGGIESILKKNPKLLKVFITAKQISNNHNLNTPHNAKTNGNNKVR